MSHGLRGLSTLEGGGPQSRLGVQMMPARSKAQQQFMGAELRRKRAGKRTRTKMTEAQLEEYASTPRKGLPKRAKGAKRGKAKGGRRR